MSKKHRSRKTLSADDFNQRVHAATKRLRDMQRNERKHGFASPETIGPYSLLLTAKHALRAGLACQHWDTVAEAYVMLEHAIALLGRDIFKAEVEMYRTRGTPAFSPAPDPNNVTH